MSRYRQTMSELLKQVRGINKNEAVDDHEISMARGELEAIADKATQLASMLQGKSDEGNPLEAWVQSKITKAKDYINSVSDYMMYNPDMKQNEELEEGIMSNIATLKSEFQRLDTDYKKMKDEYNAIMAGAYKGDESAVEKKMFKALRSLKDVRQELTSALKTVKEETLEEKGEHYIDTIKKMRKQGKSIDQIATKLNMNPDIIEIILDEEKLEEGFSSSLKAKAKDIAKKLAGNLTKAYAEIEKIAKGLSLDSEVQKALRMANEELDRPNPANPNPKELDEASIKDIFIANKEGQKADEIAKKLKMSVADVKKILGEETLEEKTYDEKEIDNFHTDLDKIVHKHFGHSSDEKKKGKMDEKVADSIIKDLQKAYGDLKGKTISTDMANRISKHLDQPSYDLDILRQLVKANIPFISTLAKNKIYKKTGKFEQLEEQDDNEKQLKIKLDKEKDTDALEKQLVALQGQNNVLKQKLENEKNKTIKPIPNPDTGEVPLTIGIANKLLKDKAEKEAKKKEMKEEKRLYVESIAAVKNKAEKTGMPYSVLKQVYDRGMAAWKGGHRPGATQVQWALARVNSFVTKSSGTWGGADKDLAAKVKGSK